MKLENRENRQRLDMMISMMNAWFYHIFNIRKIKFLKAFTIDPAEQLECVGDLPPTSKGAEAV